jgi:hypothetical protein
MGTSTITAVCSDCDKKYNNRDKAEFQIDIEWLERLQAVEVLLAMTCPNCGGQNWYLTDEMGQ